MHQQGPPGFLGAHKRYEFGCKVGIAATNREGLFIVAMAFEGNPYDGHTLKATAAKTEETTGVAIQRLYADKGYRGHDYDGRLGRNYLLGTAGDKINTLLAAAGHNLRLVLSRLALLLARFIGAVIRLMTKDGQISIPGDPGSVFPDIDLRLSGLTTSKA